MAWQVSIVVGRVVPGDAVVEEDEVSRLPLDPEDVLRPGHVVLERVEDRPRLAVGQAQDGPRETSDEQAALARLRVNPDDRVRTKVTSVCQWLERTPSSPFTWRT